jgi:hypothetical protein
MIDSKRSCSLITPAREMDQANHINDLMQRNSPTSCVDVVRQARRVAGGDDVFTSDILELRLDRTADQDRHRLKRLSLATGNKDRHSDARQR